ncbi:MAG: ribosome biogenesis GTPase YlqF [Eubacteriales bacterium]|nr:ribosome biogenesis GTPase YlqF [Eubacteriales bacterium]
MAEVQWFPGHMAKTIRELGETIKVCDLVLELCDARIPRSSRNPILDELAQGKLRLLVLNKADLADPKATEAWLEHFEQEGMQAMAINALKANDVRKLQLQIKKMSAPIKARAEARGRRSRPIRILICGVPNVGKSSLINSLIGRKKAATANKPGVTRNLQWLKLGTELQLLDSPGLLWPKLETKEEQIALGAVAAVKDDILPREELAGDLLLLLLEYYSFILGPQLELDEDDLASIFEQASREEAAHRALYLVAKSFKLVRQGGEPDLQRASQFVLKQFRAATWGKFSLEFPEDKELDLA